MIKKIRNIYNNLKSKASPTSKYYLGSVICQEWLNSFDSFKEWMISNGYQEDYTIYSETNYFSPSTSIIVTRKEARRYNVEKNNLEKYGVKNTSQLESVKENNRQRSIDSSCIDVEFYKKHKVRIRNLYYNNKDILSQEWKDDFWLFCNFLISNNWIPGLTLNGNKPLSLKTCLLIPSNESKSIETKKSCLEKYGVENPSLVEEFKNKRTQTNFERYGVENASSSLKIKNKRQKTNNSRYGVDNVFQSEDIKKKAEETNLRKYGVSNVGSSSDIKTKIEKTNLRKYGTKHSLSSKIVRDKIKKTNLERYGTEFAISAEKVRNKIAENNIKKYGCKWANSSEIIKRKSRDTRLSNNKTIFINKKSLIDISKEYPVSVMTLYRRYDAGCDTIEEITRINKTTIEIIIEKILTKNKLDYVFNKTINKYRPDFLVKDLIIEANGNYWHSDANVDKLYHKEKREYYIEKGYRPLFFCEDEIKNSPDIIESIILNKLSLSKKIFGRKTVIKQIDTITSNSFFAKNHLMGKGRGVTFGLYSDKKLVTAIRVVKKDDGLDISRFCHKINHNIIGGFSKLLKAVIKELSPNFVDTFIDLRYGSGSYLPSLGFNKETEHLSFNWVKGDKRFHRMRFPGNSGYQNGCLKLWDCGQARFRRVL